MIWANQRLTVEQLKTHKFFEDVSWDQMRTLEAPRPPTLSSITDTSYFPTEAYADVPMEPAGVEKLDADKDLAFLGYVFPSPFLAPALVACCRVRLLTRARTLSTVRRYTFKRFTISSAAF